VVRKGATPAFPGQQGFVGSTMGESSVILEGTHQGSPDSFWSTVHGAGRAMSRTQAAGKWKGWGEKRRQVSRGAISENMMIGWLDRAGVVLRGGGLDEAPQAYKRLDEVLAAHGDAKRVANTLRPVGVAMAGAGEYDPDKD
jgi:tRNA-splicing ligase RtcB